MINGTSFYDIGQELKEKIKKLVPERSGVYTSWGS
jgi:hypothetical protein